MPVVPKRVVISLAICGGLIAASPAAGIEAWGTDHESGTLSGWTNNQGPAVFNSATGRGTASARVSRDVARSGKRSLKLSLTGAQNGQTQGARVFRNWIRNKEDPIGLPNEGFYSAWFYFPTQFRTREWWNIFQFKSKSGTESKSLISLNVGNGSDGRMLLYAWHAAPNLIDGQAYDPVSDSAARIPVKRWVHVEAYLRKSTVTGGTVNQDGRLTVWVDGRPAIDRDGIQTLQDPDGELQWSVNNYTDDIRPSNPTIYVDDPAISETLQVAGAPVLPPSELLRKGTRLARFGVLPARRWWSLGLKHGKGRRVTVSIKTRDTDGRRAFVAELRCDGDRLLLKRGTREKRVRLSYKAPGRACTIRVRSGKERLNYDVRVAVKR